MRSITFGVGLILLVGISSCREKAKDPPYFVSEISGKSADATPESLYIPTNPSGGYIPGKSVPPDPSENALKQAENTAKPILWGESIAGITLLTTYSEARQALSQRLDGFNGVEIYPESIQIVWNQNEPQTPNMIRAFGSYGGRLNLPEPIGDVRLGQDLAKFFAKDPRGEGFLRLLGAHFENKDPANYDCRADLTCGLGFFDGKSQFMFRKGIISISNDLKITDVYLLPDQVFYPRVTDPIIYGTSIGGISLSSARSTTESRIGPPVAQQDAILYYDDLSILVGWNNSGLPSFVGASEGYLGDVDLPDTLTSPDRKLGDSYSDLAPANDDGTETIKILDRALEARPIDPEPYDCLTEKTCKREVVGNVLLLHLAKGSFGFTNDGQFKLVFVSLVPEQTDFSE